MECLGSHQAGNSPDAGSAEDACSLRIDTDYAKGIFLCIVKLKTESGIRYRLPCSGKP